MPYGTYVSASFILKVKPDVIANFTVVPCMLEKEQSVLWMNEWFTIVRTDMSP